MYQIMTASQHTSATFLIPEFEGVEPVFASVALGTNHPGSGEWTLEVQTPPDEDGNQTWQTLGGTGGVVFAENGMVPFRVFRGLSYRFRRTSGSAVGLRLWLQDVWSIVAEGVS